MVELQRIMFGLFAVLAPLAFATPVLAQAPRLTFFAADECPSEALFVELVESRLGRQPFDETVETTLEVTLSGVAEAWLGELRWVSASQQTLGERSVQASSCAALAESIAVAVAILLEDPPQADDPETARPGEPATPQAPETERPTEVPQPREAPEEPDVSAPWVWSASGGFGAGLGFLPDASLGIDLRLGVRRDLLGVFLRVGVDLQLAEAESRRGDAISATHYRGALEGCLLPSHLQLCVVVEAGAFQSTVRSVSEPTSQTSLDLSTGVRGAYALELGQQIHLVPFLALHVQVLRTALQVDGENIWEAPPVAGRIGLDVELLFE